MKKLQIGLLGLVIALVCIPADSEPRVALADPPVVDLVVVTDDNRLFGYSIVSSEVPLTALPISGLLQGEKINAIDFDPITGQLLAITNLGRLYKLDTETGDATLLRSLPSSFFGQRQGMDSDPVRKLLRFIGENGQNVILDLLTGLPDIEPTPRYSLGGPHAGKPISLVALAYINNNPGATQTRLFGIDVEQQALVSTPDPAVTANWTVVALFDFDNDGTTNFVVNDACFDIAPFANSAIAALQPADDQLSTFFSINLQTGKATPLGSLGLNQPVTGIALVNQFVDSSITTSRKLPTGAEHMVKVSVQSNGQPVPNTQVKLRIGSGPNAGLTQMATTNANGEATFVYRSNGQPGIDSIIATGCVGQNSFVSAAGVEWTNGPIIISIRLSGKNLVIEGLNFLDDDEVEINGQAPKSVAFKNDTKLVAKKGRNKLLVCSPGDPPKTNEVRVFRNPLGQPAPPIQDTAAFATCP